MKPAERIIVALDTPNPAIALDIAKEISPVIRRVKVGMELYYSEGPSIVNELSSLGMEVFVDLKIHDIPNTAIGAAKSLTRHGVWMWNVHVAGGLLMMQKAKEAAQEISNQLNIPMPIVIGVTQLTSTSQNIMNQYIGIPGEVKDCVVRYAKLAKQAGLDGVVASAQEVPFIKEACGKEFLTITPGIRMSNSEVHDQVRITTPRQAMDLGTDYMVIGRNITDASNRLQAAKDIIQSMK
ncbi:orotidine 5'-phosphate decarboxylase [Desulfuribacillus stibiiarsenatis]|uniref:Orotidine 5'-phosphate decarboxylase n=1 Tax=Desulfuribacillus stibiiarsenatis TaxID=1390249 RepID=A0A1E5L3S4_9FIRM|nr:orotidine-5'-phosphate decarboxylase [Desulfuribacillus stibiiarsenatis]OEH84736.1 orotidine 5'-phosphate decarboxylase [Desulfuribacillus stibiiarsenatis]